MNPIKIVEMETGVPMRQLKTKYPGLRLYPLDDMEVGNSFHWPTEELQEITRVRNACSYYKRTHAGWDFRTTQTKTGVRVWRVA